MLDAASETIKILVEDCIIKQEIEISFDQKASVSFFIFELSGPIHKNNNHNFDTNFNILYTKSRGLKLNF